MVKCNPCHFACRVATKASVADEDHARRVHASLFRKVLVSPPRFTQIVPSLGSAPNRAKSGQIQASRPCIRPFPANLGNMIVNNRRRKVSCSEFLALHLVEVECWRRLSWWRTVQARHFHARHHDPTLRLKRGGGVPSTTSPFDRTRWAASRADYVAWCALPALTQFRVNRSMLQPIPAPTRSRGAPAVKWLRARLGLCSDLLDVRRVGAGGLRPAGAALHGGGLQALRKRGARRSSPPNHIVGFYLVGLLAFHGLAFGCFTLITCKTACYVWVRLRACARFDVCLPSVGLLAV